MRKVYIKLKAELLPVETEAGFLACSVRVKKSVTVEPYHEYFQDGMDGVVSVGDSDTKAFQIGFDE